MFNCRKILYRVVFQAVRFLRLNLLLSSVVDALRSIEVCHDIHQPKATRETADRCGFRHSVSMRLATVAPMQSFVA